MKIDGEFERARVDDRSVGGDQADAGAGVGGAREKERAGRDRRGELSGESARRSWLAPEKSVEARREARRRGCASDRAPGWRQP